MLAYWNARMAGAKVPQESIENVCDFLIRVQDPSGGWCYNGTDASSWEADLAPVCIDRGQLRQMIAADHATNPCSRATPCVA